jgi:peptidoglycan/xylan/chitin deacetylase (PgdA/CDA1 family)
MYHSLADGRFPDAEYPKYTTTRAEFAEHLRLLLHNGFHLAGFSDFLGRLAQGRGIPEKYCLLTFDDGHKSSLELAELMLNAGVRATFFLTMNYCRERADFLKPEEIRQLAKEGFDFGTHGVSHRGLSRMPEAQMRAEVRESKMWLEDVLNERVRAMSLPAGEGGAPVCNAAFEAGYSLIGNSVEQMNNFRRLPAEINRFVMLSGYTGRLVCRIAGGSPAYICRRRVRKALLALPRRILRTYDRTRS